MFSLYLFQILLGCLTLALCRLWYQHITTSIAHRKFIQKYGCKEPAAMSRKDPFFGLDLIRDAVHAAETKTSITRQVSLYAQYGNTFSTRFLMTPVINTIERENITTILTEKFDDYGIGSRRKEAFAPLLGQSIFQVDGLEWKHSRDLVRLCLSKVEMENLPRLDVHVDNLVGAILRHGSMVDLGELFPRLTADITTDYMFGKSLMSLRDSSSLRNSFMEAIHESQAGCEKRWLMGPFARVIPQRSFYKNVEKVHKFMDQLIDEAQQLRKPALSNSEPVEERQKRHSVLDELQHLIGSKRLLRDELLTMFFAGVDTAAALLTNLFFTLGKRPDIWRELRHEVEPLQGERPTNAQLSSLTYHRSCLKECKLPVLIPCQVALLRYQCTGVDNLGSSSPTHSPSPSFELTHSLQGHCAPARGRRRSTVSHICSQRHYSRIWYCCSTSSKRPLGGGCR